MSAQRSLNLPDTRSFFLFGPGQTGKSSLILDRYSAAAWSVNLLHSEDLIRYAKQPGQYRLDALEQYRAGRRFVLDEVQRVPDLLNEVHALLELHPDAQFIMLGSSARKLKRGGANLLGGRAVQRFLYPFTRAELSERFDLDDALRFGTLPPLLGLPAAFPVYALSAASIPVFHCRSFTVGSAPTVPTTSMSFPGNSS